MKFSKCLVVVFSSLFCSFAMADSKPERNGPIVCLASAKSSQNVVFDYSLVGTGEIVEDGYLRLDEGMRVYVNMRQAPDWLTKVLLNGVEPIYQDGGLGHFRFSVPGSRLGLTLEIGYSSHRIGISHKISATEELYATGECKEID